MKIMKLFRSLLFAIILTLSITACSQPGVSMQTTTQTTTPLPLANAISSPTPSPTPVATPSPTTTPTSTPTPSPTPTHTTTIAPSPTPKPKTDTPTKQETSSVKILSVTSPAKRNSTASLKAKVEPNTNASIVVHYKSGASTAAGLESKKADSNGNVSWSWKVGGNTTLGSWRIDITSGDSTAETYFEVVH